LTKVYSFSFRVALAVLPSSTVTLAWSNEATTPTAGAATMATRARRRAEVVERRAMAATCRRNDREGCRGGGSR